MDWFKQLCQRLTWSVAAYRVDPHNPIIKLDNGLSFDLEQRRIIFDGDVNLHVKGNFSITVDGDMIMSSPKREFRG